MPTLKKRSGKASRNGRMSVYLPRSAVSPTISGRRAAERDERLAERRVDRGAAGAGRLVLAHGQRAGAGQPSAATPCLEFGDERVPLARLDADEMRLLARLERRHALAGERAQHDRLRLAVAVRARRAARRRSPPCRCRRSPASPSRRRATCRRPAPCRGPGCRRPGCRCSRSARRDRRGRNGLADIAASQVAPSCISPSESSTKTRAGEPSSRRPSAWPTPWPRPWPSEPPIISTPGVVSSVLMSSRLSSAP